jgi:hypothetical protein
VLSALRLIVGRRACFCSFADNGLVYGWGYSMGDKPTLIKQLQDEKVQARMVSCGMSVLFVAS